MSKCADVNMGGKSLPVGRQGGITSKLHKPALLPFS